MAGTFSPMLWEYDKNIGCRGSPLCPHALRHSHMKKIFGPDKTPKSSLGAQHHYFFVFSTDGITTPMSLSKRATHTFTQCFNEKLKTIYLNCGSNCDAEQGRGWLWHVTSGPSLVAGAYRYTPFGIYHIRNPTTSKLQWVSVQLLSICSLQAPSHIPNPHFGYCSNALQISRNGVNGYGSIFTIVFSGYQINCRYHHSN